MEHSIHMPVGEKGLNWAHDVKTVCDSLNSLAEELGGSARQPLVPPVVQNPTAIVNVTGLSEAIQRFQKKRGLPVTGRIEPGSPAMMQLSGLTEVSRPDELADLRQRIISTARRYVGKIGDNLTAAEAVETGGLRRGWEIMQRMFDDTLATKRDWESPGKGLFLGPNGPVYITNKEGLQQRRMRVPTFGLKPSAVLLHQLGLNTDGNGGISWCGVFAFWTWRLCGLDVKWPPQSGGNTLPLRNQGFEAMQPGDIAVIPTNVHHFMVTKSPKETGNVVDSIDANAADQQVIEYTGHHKLSTIRGYYSLEDLAKPVAPKKAQLAYKG